MIAASKSRLRTLLIFALVFPMLGLHTISAESDSDARNRICSRADAIGRAIVKSRDSGVGEVELLNHLDSRWRGPRLRLAHMLVPPIYDNPKMTAQQASDLAVKTCVSNFAQLEMPESESE